MTNDYRTLTDLLYTARDVRDAPKDHPSCPVAIPQTEPPAHGYRLKETSFKNTGTRIY